MQHNDFATVDELPTLADELDQLAPNSAENKVGLERQQFDVLLKHALYVTGGDYAFVLSAAGTGAYAEQFVRLGAAVEREKSGQVQPCYDTLANRRPDPMILSVMRLRRGVEGKPTDIGLPLCLPGSHPPIRYFLMAPLASGSSRTSVIFVANPDTKLLRKRGEGLMQQVCNLGDVLVEHQKRTLVDAVSNSLDSGLDDGARHYIQLMNASLNAVVIVDSTGTITAFNPAAEKLFGRQCAHALGTGFDRYLPQDFLMPILRHAHAWVGQSIPSTVAPGSVKTVSAICESGHTVFLKTLAYFTRVGQAVYTTFVFEHELNAQTLQEGHPGHQHYRALTNVAPVGIVQLSADWTCDYAN